MARSAKGQQRTNNKHQPMNTHGAFTAISPGLSGGTLTYPCADASIKHGCWRLCALPRFGRRPCSPKTTSAAPPLSAARNLKDQDFRTPTSSLWPVPSPYAARSARTGCHGSLWSSHTSMVGGNKFGSSRETVEMSMVSGRFTISYDSWLPQLPQNWRLTPCEER